MKKGRSLAVGFAMSALGMVCGSVVITAQGPPPGPPVAAAPGDPFANLTATELRVWQLGKQSFQTAFDVPSGLGPVFTESSCFKCHDAGGSGGAGTRLVTHFGRIVGGEFDPMVSLGGPQVQNRGIGKFHGVDFVGEVVPRQATIVANRRTIPLFGLGLVDAVPDSTFVAMAEQQAAQSPDTAGVAHSVTDPVTGEARVGKFGWKAQEPTLVAFIADALQSEIGVTTPVFPAENCPQGDCALLEANSARTNPNETNTGEIESLENFVALLAPPPVGRVTAAAQAGAGLFSEIGCAHCHAPTLETGPSAIAALNSVTFAPYSDFLLHDMGTLGDGIVQNGAGGTMMRTAPLWGLRFEPSYLHDGRAATPDAAIRAHSGQGQAAANAYVSLTASEKADLLAFLNSL